MRIAFAGICLLLCLGRILAAADEAEHKVFTFKNAGDAWGGNGPLKFGNWPVRDQALRLTVDGSAQPNISKSDLNMPADQANVVQLRCDAGAAPKLRLWFTTAVSPAISQQKMVECDLPAGTGPQDCTLDLKDLPSWKDRITSLRFDFIGAKPGTELAVRRITVFEGAKISTPMVYAAWRPGQKSEVKEFRLGCLFSDGMVLQQGRPVPVWGRSRPGETVTVGFAGQTRQARADEQGRWQVALADLPANGEPAVMTVTSDVADHRIELKDVVVGDVWLCGGQSNMGGSPLDNAPPAELRKEMLATDHPLLRVVSMPSLHRETPLPNDATEDALSWRPAKAASLRGISAVSYYLGQAIHRSQKIPVGLLLTIKAGSQVEQWLDAEALKSIFTDAELAASCTGSHLASGLFNGMVAPIRPFPIRGTMWYQGESNADNEARYLGYYKSLPALIRSWRGVWGADLPVLLVQLPGFDGRYPPESWAHIREVQQLAATHLPHVGLAVSFDEGDVTNLHPNNKWFIGSRLGLAARSVAYGEKILASGPVLAGCERQGEGLVLRFTAVAGGLKARGDLSGFEIRGADQRWMPATAAITAPDRIEVRSAQLTEPVAVRYAWANAPHASLFNDAGLPASPFRSDVPEALVAAVRQSGLASAGR